MSSNARNLPNSIRDHRRYLRYIVKQGWVQEIWLAGSRSRKVEREPHKDSDYDYIVVAPYKRGTFQVAEPRATGRVNACLSLVDEDWTPLPSHVMIYPKDDTGLNFKLNIK